MDDDAAAADDDGGCWCHRRASVVLAQIVLQLRVTLERLHFLKSTITVNHLISDETILVDARGHHY